MSTELLTQGHYPGARAFVFFRRFNSRRESIGLVPLYELPAEEGPVGYVLAAEKASGLGLSKRTGHTGVFEVQTEAGIWSATDEGSLTRYDERRGCHPREAAAFRTWDELDDEEHTTMKPHELRLPALEVTQGPGRKLYLSSVDGKLVPRFATVSRLKRTESKGLVGYQRPEVLRHIQQIRDYIEAPGAMVPNAVVMAFDTRVRFVPYEPQELKGMKGAGVGVTYMVPGTLVIPLAEEGVEEHTLPGFIVDGQQRLAAVRDASVECYPLAFTAFIAATLEEQTEQFILVNSTKPLPKGLIYELLPKTQAHLPEKYQHQRLPAALLERLNLDEASPLQGLIITQTNPRMRGKGRARTFSGIMKDTSLLNALGNSLSDGVLFEYVDRETREPDTEGMLALLYAWWGAVQDTFPQAWGKPLNESRLFAGSSVVAVSFLLDQVSHRLKSEHGIAKPTREQLAHELGHVKAECFWTEGKWEFSRTVVRKWNDIQNTGKDTALLYNHLIKLYIQKSAGKPPLKTRTKKAG